MTKTNQLTTVEDVMNASGVGFGTSGARGLVSAMSDRVCHAYVYGFIEYLRELGEWNAGMKLALAGDLRASTPRILQACAQAVLDQGGQPVFCGMVPTPVLAMWAFQQGVPSLMVTGSHIPDDRNGIKFYRRHGEILKSDELGIKRQKIRSSEAVWGDDGMLPSPPDLGEPESIAAPYINRYVDFFGAGALQERRVAVYQHSAVGRDILAEILRQLGADVTLLGRSEVFVPVDTEAVRSEDIHLAHQWAAAGQYDAIASTDGDSDRPLLADESGNWLRGDVLGVICAKYLGAATVVTPVSSNSIVVTCGAFPEVRRTKIGSPFVIAAMNEAIAASGAAERLVCGYEANGGFLVGTAVRSGNRTLAALPTRDAVLPIICALAMSRESGLRALLDDLPPSVTYSDRIQQFPQESSSALMAWMLAGEEHERNARLSDAFAGIAGAPLGGIDLTDGVRMEFSNARVIHLRPSGNAPELRCYTEAENEACAARLNRMTLDWIKAR